MAGKAEIISVVNMLIIIIIIIIIIIVCGLGRLAGPVEVPSTKVKYLSKKGTLH